ncbi:MAG TPA: cytochrome c [Gemmataceae bacterium]|nr:cytochrome c [Gemmataceae bacterium]
MTTPCRWLIGHVSIAMMAVVLGCTKPTAPSGGGEQQPEGANTPTASLDAKQLYEQQCAKCHGVMGGESGRNGKKGGRPDLSKVGADPAHTPDWIAEHIRNPQSHKPDSKMPAFEGKLQPEQIKSVADYLAGMK